jgi:hypothetical protein
MRRAAAAAALALAAACESGPQQMSDWERKNPELLATQESAATPKPPPAPRKENLIEFYVGPTATFRYFIDAASLSVFYKQKEIRYVVIARSPSGVDNVSYEALRCTGEHRTIAVGQSDGAWRERAGDWMPVRPGTGWASVLMRQFFCPHNDPIQSVREGVEALRLGAHPLVYVETRPLPPTR